MEIKPLDLNKRKIALTGECRSVDAEKGKIKHVINTKVLDRYGTVVLPKGADVENYLKNAVVLWSHNMDAATMGIPIGRCVGLEITDGEIVAETEFNLSDPLALRVFNAYKEGFLHAWSIGFMPKTYEDLTEENLDFMNTKYGLNITVEQLREAGGGWGCYVINKWELFEYSAVPVPANPEAVNQEDFKSELQKRGLLEVQVRETEPTQVAPVVEPVATAAPVAELAPAVAPAVESAPDEDPQPAAQADVTPQSTEAEVPPVVDAEMARQVSELTQKNLDLAERLAKLEALAGEVTTLRAENTTLKQELSDLKQSLEVASIEKIRLVAQKHVGSENVGFFSSLMKNR